MKFPIPEISHFTAHQETLSSDELYPHEKIFVLKDGRTVLWGPPHDGEQEELQRLYSDRTTENARYKRFFTPIGEEQAANNALMQTSLDSPKAKFNEDISDIVARTTDGHTIVAHGNVVRTGDGMTADVAYLVADRPPYDYTGQGLGKFMVGKTFQMANDDERVKVIKTEVLGSNPAMRSLFEQVAHGEIPKVHPLEVEIGREACGVVEYSFTLGRVSKKRRIFKQLVTKAFKTMTPSALHP